MSRLPFGPSQPLISWIPGIKQLAGEFENSPISSAEVKNEWSYTPLPPIGLNGLHMDNSVYS